MYKDLWWESGDPSCQYGMHLQELDWCIALQGLELFGFEHSAGVPLEEPESVVCKRDYGSGLGLVVEGIEAIYFSP
jgi:hypothetical protein